MSLKPEFVTLAKAFFQAQNVTQGLSGEQHTALVRDWLCESVITDYSKEALDEAKSNLDGFDITGMTAEDIKDNTEYQTLKRAYEHIKRTRADMYTALYPLMNGSALRQRFEDAGVLTKTAGGKKSADATALANKYV